MLRTAGDQAAIQSKKTPENGRIQVRGTCENAESNQAIKEAKLREMVESEPANAAQLLLNISKMLCLRLLTDR